MTKVEITRSEATNEAYIYSARLMVGMFIDYFSCIALKIVVLEMIALIKKWTIKCLGIQNLIRFSVFKSEVNNWQILLLAHCSTETEN